jgi:hypothetical protein
MRIYSIFITVLFVVAGVMAFSFYSEAKFAKAKLSVTQTLLDQSRSELNNLHQLIDSGLVNAKSSTALLNDSLASFLVAGNLKIASLSDISAQKISDNIQQVSNPQDKVALEQGWSDFLKSRKIGDYLAFSRFLIQNIQNNLGNIH